VYLNEARSGDREWILVSQILTVESAEEEARRGWPVLGTERDQMQFVWPSRMLIEDASAVD
jgi:hypothetical protein